MNPFVLLRKWLAAIFAGCLAVSASHADQPNIIFLLTDDLGYSDISCYGATKVSTPHIDQLAENGIKFTDFHSAASICSPSRAAFLTGGYPQRAGLYMGINPIRDAHWFLGLHPDEITIAEQCQQQGYATYHVGKWHLGTEPEFMPRKQGFDHTYGMHCNYSHSPVLYDDDEVVFKKTPLDQLTALYTDRVTEIIRESAKSNKPFFLYYAHNYPHTPYKASAKFAGSSKDGVRGDMMQEMDWGIGEMMKALDDAGIADNTLVIFTSDNGPNKNEHAQPFQGTKYVTHEGGHRVPFIVHWPDSVKAGGVSAANIHAMDLFPTLSEVIGAELPTDRVYDGESLLPLLTGGALTRSPDEPFFYYNCENLQAIRKGDWKIHLPRSPQQIPFWQGGKGITTLDEPLLYDLKSDPGESKNVADEHPEIVTELTKLAEQTREQLGEYGQRGDAQRATGSIYPESPVISHSRDWKQVPAEIAAGLETERARRRSAPAKQEKATPLPKGKPGPNIVLIFADDLGYGDLGCYGATKVQTPNIDQLATEGRKFTDAHSASAVCTPSRYALMTGEYPFRRNLSRPVFLKTGLVIDTEKLTAPDVLKGAGYATACIGKWHLGFGEKAPDWNGELKPGPLELGFDYYYGVPVVNSHPPFVYVENYRVVGHVPEDPFVFGKKANTREFFEKMGLDQIGGADAAHALYDDEMVGTRLTEKSIDWIKQQGKNPFFLYLSTTNIHHPFTPHPRFKGTSQCGPYGDYIHELDWMVGEVMKTLEEQGVADNTLVIFTSDNGGMFNVGGQNAWDDGHRLNGELLGFKFGAWEGGHRIPFIARWPGKIKANTTSKTLVSNIDMLATFGALTGTRLNQSQSADSVNILPALTGNPEKPLRDHIILAPSKPGNISIRKGKWMYIAAQGSGGFTAAKRGAHAFGGPAAISYAGYENSDIENSKVKADAPPAQLYDLETDLKQTTNLYQEHPEVVAEMKALLKGYGLPRVAAKRNPSTKGGAEK